MFNGKLTIRFFTLSILLGFFVLLPGFAFAGSQTFTASGTFTVPTGVTAIALECWAGGAGGAGSMIGGGNGGGGGAYSKKNSYSVSQGEQYAVTVGGAGTAGTGGMPGGAGGDSKVVDNQMIPANIVFAQGGQASTGGSAGSGTGDTKYSGGNGGTSTNGGGGGGSSAGTGADGNVGSNGSGNNGGSGGSAVTGGGAGGNGGNSGSNGSAGSVPGGGGGGAGNGADGAAGAAGKCIITWPGADYYWVGDDGDWTDATNHWATSSGGSPNSANIPTSIDNVYFDANSCSTGTCYVTIDDVGIEVGGVYITATDINVDVNGNGLNAYKDVTVNGEISDGAPSASGLDLFGEDKNISGGGIISAAVYVGDDHTFDSDADLIITGVFEIDTGVTVTNDGSVGIYEFAGDGDWVQGADSFLDFYGYYFDNVTVTASATGNTVSYFADGDAIIAGITYYDLFTGPVLSQTSTYTLDNSFTILDNATFSNDFSTGFNLRIENAGSATFELTGDDDVSGSIWNVVSGNNVQLIGNGIDIEITNTGNSTKTFIGGNEAYGDLTITGDGMMGANGILTIEDDNSWGDFTINDPKSIKFESGSTQVIGGTVDCTASAAPQNITIRSTTNDQQHYLEKTSGTVSCNYLDLRDSNAGGGATWYAGGDSTNSGGNSGWIFSDVPVDYYWVGGTGNWSDDDNHWATSSGGSPANGNLPSSSDNVHFDGNSGTGTVTQDNLIGVTVAGFDLSSSNITVAVSNPLTISGDAVVSGTISGVAPLTFSGASKTISGSGGTISATQTISESHTITATTLNLSGATNISSGKTVTNNGSVTVADFSTSAGSWVQGSSSSLTYKGTSFGTVAITASATSNTVNYTGDGAVNLPSGTTTYYNLQIGNATTQTAGRTYTLGANTAITGVLTVGPSGGSNTQTLDASSRTITLSGGNGLPFIINAHGAFTASTSTVNYTSNADTNMATTTYYNLQVGNATTQTAGRTYTLAGDITVGNVLTVGPSSGSNTQIFDASSYTVTLSGGTGTPFVIQSQGTFTASTSTVNYTGNAGTTIKATTYYNLDVGNATTQSSGQVYTLGGNTTVTNALTVGPTGGSFTQTLAGSTYTITLSGTGTIFSVRTNGGFTANTSGFSITNTSVTSKTFAGAGKTYGDMAITGGGAGEVIFSGSNTFDDFSVGYPKTVKFTASTTTTIGGTVSLVGTVDDTITILSTTTNTAATLTKTSGTISGDYLDIKDSTANGGATWNAGCHSTNSGGNSGWNFGACASVDYYWVGGTGNWSDATNHWATSSGGSPNVNNIPTSIDSVFFDSSSGTGTCTIDIDEVEVADFNNSSNVPVDTTSFGLTINGDTTISGTGLQGSNTVTFSGSDKTIGDGFLIDAPVVFTADHDIINPSDYAIFGDTVTINSGVTVTNISYVVVPEFVSTGTWTQTDLSGLIYLGSTVPITLNATATDNFVSYSGDRAQTIKAISYYHLNVGDDNFTHSHENQTNHRTYTLGGNIAVAGEFFFGNQASSNKTMTLALSTFTVTLSGTGDVFYVDTSGFPVAVTAGTSTINITNTSATEKVFTGGGKTYNNVAITGGGSGAVTIAGSNTFGHLTLGYPKTIKFTAGTTQTISSQLTCAGTSGNIITIRSTTNGSYANLSSGVAKIACDYLDLKDSNATGGATWDAGCHSISTSHNAGWNFVCSDSSYLTQKHFKFYQDDASLNAATQYNPQDIKYNIPVSTIFRLRIQTANMGAGSVDRGRRLQFREDGGSWTTITTNSNNVRLADSSNFTDATATTSRLTPTGTFIAGEGKDTGATTTTTTINGLSYVEDEFSLILQSSATGHTYQFKLVDEGSADLDAYAVYPSISDSSVSSLNLNGILKSTGTFIVR